MNGESKNDAESSSKAGAAQAGAEGQECTEVAAGAKAEEKKALSGDIREYFGTLAKFNESVRHDKRLTPAIQLVYRILLETGNRQYWADPMECSDAWLMELTRYSRQTITEAKRQLKNLGYIDFSGKPSKYHLYSLVGDRAGKRVGNSGGPLPQTPTPEEKTERRENKTEEKERGGKKENEGDRYGWLRGSIQF